jgi:pantetheine-phosphate adenylyltransferase
MFDKIYVAVGVNPEKRNTFSLEKRISMIQNAFPGEDRIKVVSFEKEFLVNFCAQNSIDIMIRGIRNVQDFEYEQQLLYINERINSSIQSVYIIPPSEYAGLSSSMIKGLVGFSEWQFAVKDLIPEGNLSFIMNAAFAGKELDSFLRRHVSEVFYDEVKDLIYSNYNATGRYYHTIQHVNEMLANLQGGTLIDGDKSIPTDALSWAVVFHDFVYNPTSVTNEEDSATQWENFCDKYLSYSGEFKHRVSELIMVTKTHTDDNLDFEKKFMIDLDLMILGADTNRFNEYERQIRYEYSFVGDGVYKLGRIDWIKKFLSRNRLFMTDIYQEEYETKARENLNKLVIALERL